MNHAARTVLTFSSFLFAIVISHAVFAQQPPNALAGSTQLVLVTTADWSAVSGTLQRYERANTHERFRPMGKPVAIVVGKTGLAWGRGVVDLPHGDADPVKKEGDGKAPAGVFRLSSAFGYAKSARPGTKMPYIALTPSVECVDDPNSKFYNRVLDRNSVTPDWNSSEHMLRNDDLYRWGVIVDHNATPAVAGAGSCIFLHIAHSDGGATVGCTAMPQNAIEELLRWLDPKRKPLLVQIPQSMFKREDWQLPPQ